MWRPTEPSPEVIEFSPSTTISFILLGLIALAFAFKLGNYGRALQQCQTRVSAALATVRRFFGFKHAQIPQEAVEDNLQCPLTATQSRKPPWDVISEASSSLDWVCASCVGCGRGLSLS